MQGRVIILVHCTPPQYDLSTYEVSSWYMYLKYFLRYAPDKNVRWKDRRTYLWNGTYVTFPLIFLAIFSLTRLKKRHTSKNRMNRIKGNLLLPIVLQVTHVPLGLYGRTEGKTGGDYFYIPRHLSAGDNKQSVFLMLDSAIFCSGSIMYLYWSYSLKCCKQYTGSSDLDIHTCIFHFISLTGNEELCFVQVLVIFLTEKLLFWWS
jgi:hypothetical protein